MSYVLTPYYDTLHILSDEKSLKQHRVVKSNYTNALIGHHLDFDLSQSNVVKDGHLESYKLLMPLHRGTKKSSVKYAIAEANWYNLATRKIDMILPYGKIWGTMTDEDGLVNSNYGYQIHHSNDLKSTLRDVDKAVNENADVITFEFHIINEENQSSSSDLVCNNIISFRLKRRNDHIYDMDFSVIARSIDMIFGLPYDMFAAQSMAAQIAMHIQAYSYDKTSVYFNALHYDIANCHLYFRDLDDVVKSFKQLRNDAALAIDVKSTPYFLNLCFHSTDELNEYRNSAAKQSSIELVKESTNVHRCDESYLSSFSCMSSTLQDKDELHRAIEYVENIFDSTLQENDNTSKLVRKQIDLVEKRLNQDKFDRKSVIYDGKTIAYVEYKNNKWYILYKKLIGKKVLTDNDTLF